MNAADESAIKPEWVRVNTALRVVEIGRTALAGYVKSQAVKSRLLKKPGNVRGTRLICLPSLLELVEEADTTVGRKKP